jgi:RHH-type proline utilization regulon transcriptional repressor/proline dehydrogenase/delta 1-pyrroline-5-carboxylate dehydrogenase
MATPSASCGRDARLHAVSSADPDVAIWSGPVTTSGRVELLPFLHEQSVSITAHRFGNPDKGMQSLVV